MNIIMKATYIECALWASTDDEDEPLDMHTLAPDAREALEADCDEFLDYVEDLGIDWSEIDSSQMGHDLWLTRNRHGAGFWDRGLGELGDALTKAAHAMGSRDLYVGDDGLVYVC